jgi:hypothetical protein
MGGLSKSIWNIITNGIGGLGTPASTDLIPYAPQPGAPMVTNIKGTTVADLLAGGGGALDIGLRRATITLNDAQIKALADSFVTVQAGVPGKVMTVVSTIWKQDFSGAAYTNLAAANGSMFFTSGNAQSSIGFRDNVNAGSTAFTGFFSQTTPDVWFGTGEFFLAGKANLISGVVQMIAAPDEPFDLSPIGAPLLLSCNNQGSGPFTGGNAANTLVIQVLYWIA